MTMSRWRRIQDDSIYFAEMYFISHDNGNLNAEYIYGYAVPDKFSRQSTDNITISRDKETDSDFWTATVHITGKKLKTMLNMAESGQTLKDIMNSLGVSFDVRERESAYRRKIHTAIEKTLICNGLPLYKPEFIQPALCLHTRTIDTALPLLSFGDETEYCESLAARDKRCLYVDSEGKPDYARIKRLWKCMASRFPRLKNERYVNEFSRLGNFEVFFPIYDDEERKHDGIKVSIRHGHDENDNPYAHGIDIKIDHEKLTGNFIVRVVLENTFNSPVTDSVYALECVESDILQSVEISENISAFEVSVWHMVSGISQLIYQERSTLILDIHINIQISGRQAKVLLKKKNTSHEYSIEHFDTLDFENHAQDNTLSRQEQDVQKDFREVIGAPDMHSVNDSRFFPKVIEGKNTRSEDFIEWLKDILRSRMYGQDKISRIVLIDPYIDVSSLVKFAASITDSEISYEVYTDAQPSKTRREDSENRLQNIRNISESLDHIVPASFVVKAVEGDSVFHDRFLILCRENSNPLVYSLSNSLDGMAEKHPSVAVYCPPKTGLEVYQYYKDIIHQRELQGKIQLLYDSKSQQSGHSEEIEHPKESTFDEFKRIYESNPAKAIECLNRMYNHEALSHCKNFLESLPYNESLMFCRRIISNALNKPVPELNEFTKRDILLFYQNVMKGIDDEGKFFDIVTYFADSYISRYIPRGYYDVQFASSFIYRHNPNDFIQIFSDMFNDILSVSQTNTTEPLKIAVYSMMLTLIREIYRPKMDIQNLRLLLKSDIPFLKVLSLVFFWFDLRSKLFSGNKINLASLIKDTCAFLEDINSREAWLFRIYLISMIQDIKSGQAAKAFIDALEYQAVQNFPGTENTAKLEQQLKILDRRNMLEHCRILWKLYVTGKISQKDYAANLTELCFAIYDNEDKYPKNGYTEQDIRQSSFIIQHLLNELDIEVLKNLSKRMEKQERILCTSLHRPYFMAQNHHEWLNSVNRLCCLIALEYCMSETQFNSIPHPVSIGEFHALTDIVSDELKRISSVYRYVIDMENALK